MKKLFVLMVLLVALFAYAVPPEEDVGAGYNVAFEETGVCAVLQSLISIKPNAVEGIGGAILQLYAVNVPQIEEAGYLQEAVMLPDICVVSMCVTINKKKSHQTLRKILFQG